IAIPERKLGSTN
ncbi:hypothetical protein CP061683_2598B, partial [Chlamydia psittaci 06-1683]